MITTHDTIAAIATPVGVAGIGIVRLSGPDSVTYLTQCFRGATSNFEPRRMYFGSLVLPTEDSVLDQVCVVYFKSPQSYTGEDVVEVHCHSSAFLLNRVLTLFLDMGATLAGKGDFTKRAFINGKFDLTGAESVIDLIHAQTQQQHAVSLNRVEGKLLKHIQGIRTKLVNYLEHIEGSIDFPDEVPAVDRLVMKQELHQLNTQLDHMVSIQDMGALVQGGIHCVVVGRPNVGKSSLFNALLSQNRSIVTDIPGTTRDYIKESLDYDGYLVHLYDTAGLREEGDVIEFMGMEKIKDLITNATLVFWVVDQSMPFTDDDLRVFEAIQSHLLSCVVFNKSDLPSKLDRSHEAFESISHQLDCSIHQTDSIQQLKQCITSLTVDALSKDDMELLCNVRQKSCLTRLHQAIKALCHALNDTVEDDILAVDIAEAVAVCSEMTGDAITEEVLDGIFSRFCVGK